jgi:hypothetical protein
VRVHKRRRIGDERQRGKWNFLKIGDEAEEARRVRGEDEESRMERWRDGGIEQKNFGSDYPGLFTAETQRSRRR